jgi:hypothetical protein
MNPFSHDNSDKLCPASFDQIRGLWSSKPLIQAKPGGSSLQADGS